MGHSKSHNLSFNFTLWKNFKIIFLNAFSAVDLCPSLLLIRNHPLQYAVFIPIANYILQIRYPHLPSS